MESYGVFSFFLLGLLGGYGHCAGMCNPFVLYVASRFPASQPASWFRNLQPHLFYNLGRLTTYTSLGLLFGILGKISSDLSRFQGITALVSGLFLVSYGLLGLSGVAVAKRLESVTIIGTILKALAHIQPRSPFLIGLILGFLPCGLIYSALAGAMALGTPLLGGGAMALFGFGTSVAMMTIALFGNYLSQKKGPIQTCSFLFLVGMGIYFTFKAIF